MKVGKIGPLEMSILVAITTAEEKANRLSASSEGLIDRHCYGDIWRNLVLALDICNPQLSKDIVQDQIAKDGVFYQLASVLDKDLFYKLHNAGVLRRPKTTKPKGVTVI